MDSAQHDMTSKLEKIRAVLDLQSDCEFVFQDLSTFRLEEIYIVLFSQLLHFILTWIKDKCTNYTLQEACSDGGLDC
jgi:hypothetical protein